MTASPITSASSPSAGGVAPRGSRPAQDQPRRRRPRLRTDQIGLYGLLTVAALVALAPLAWMLSGSLQTLTELLGNESFVPESPQWSNYVTAWETGNLGVHLRNSILYTGAALVGILITASLAGYALARMEFAGKGAITSAAGGHDHPGACHVPRPVQAAHQPGTRQQPDRVHCNSHPSGIPMSTLIMRSFFVSQPKDLGGRSAGRREPTADLRERDPAACARGSPLWQ